jgi:serine-type D-Ala-D-Ala carboxypeptidase/endopeptidase
MARRAAAARLALGSSDNEGVPERMLHILLCFAIILSAPALAGQQVADSARYPAPPEFGAIARAPVVLDSAQVYTRIAERVASGRNRAIAVAVIDAAGVRYFSEGRAESDGWPVDHNTVFEIGSVSKVFTALLLAEMVERHELRLDNPASMYLPDTMRMPGMGGDSITLLHLATHMSGLPRLPLNLTVRNMRNPYADYHAQQLYAFLGGYQMQRPAGQQYEYSNLGAGLLGHLLALRGGSTYQALLLERVIRPLGMRETMVTLGPTLEQRLATGHDALGEPTAPWDFGVLAGAGALKSTSADLALLVRASLAAGDAQDQRPIVRALRSSMQSHAFVQEGRASMGLGWHIFERGARTIVMHNGRTGGFASFVGMDLDRGIGVVLLTNSSAPVDDIGFALLTSN